MVSRSVFIAAAFGIVVLLLVAVLVWYPRSLHTSLPSIEIQNQNPDFTVSLGSSSRQRALLQTFSSDLQAAQISKIHINLVKDAPKTGRRDAWGFQGGTQTYAAYLASLDKTNHTFTVNVYLNAPLLIQYNWKKEQVSSLLEAKLITGLIEQLEHIADAQALRDSLVARQAELATQSNDLLFTIQYAH